MKDVIIVGSGGFGREVSWLAGDCGRIVRGFLDDRRERGERVYGVPVLGRVTDWARHRDAEFVVAVGNPRARREIVEHMEETGVPTFTTLVHPSVIASGSVRIGEGSIVCAGCVLTVNVTLGRHVIVNVQVAIGHEDVIGDFCTVAPAVMLSGDVRVEQGAEIGASSVIRQGLRIGAGAMLGMGSVVTHDVEPNMLCMGTPARPFRTLSPFAGV